jgi:hypothetical protein
MVAHDTNVLSTLFPDSRQNIIVISIGVHPERHREFVISFWSKDRCFGNLTLTTSAIKDALVIGEDLRGGGRSASGGG